MVNLSRQDKTSEKISAGIKRFRFAEAQKASLHNILSQPMPYIEDDRLKSALLGHIMKREDHSGAGAVMENQNNETLFLQLNYCRYSIYHLRQELWASSRWRKRDLLELLDWQQKYLELRNRIVADNIWLVTAMTKRVHYPGIDHADLISEGSLALMRATDKFNYSRGFKFSTYACRAILTGFARTAQKGYRRGSMFVSQLDDAWEKSDHSERRRENAYRDMVEEVRSAVRDNLAFLSAREQKVMELRFSLNGEKGEPLTLKQVGEIFGLSRERIRQIQKRALDKLREAVKQRVYA